MDDFANEVQTDLIAIMEDKTGTAPDPRSERLARIMANLRRAFLNPLRRSAAKL